MAWMHPAAVKYQRQRFMRPDAERYLKPSPERWLSPQELRLEHPELYEREHGGQRLRKMPSSLDVIRSDPISRLRAISLIRTAQLEIAMLRHELALRKAYLQPEPTTGAGRQSGRRAVDS